MRACDYEVKKELELLKVRLLNIEAENHLLKQQLQPHFLFNSLTTLKGIIRKNPSESTDFITHFATFLRASISNHPSHLSPLHDE